MHARIAVYQFKAGKGEEAAKKAEEGILPIFRKHAGFHSYAVVLTGGDMGYSISTWDNQQQATEAVKAAESWVKANIADDVVSAQNHVGKVAFSHRASSK